MKRGRAVSIAMVCLSALPLSCGSGNDDPATDVKLAVVALPEVLQAIKAQRGKVVLLDLWGEF